MSRCAVRPETTGRLGENGRAQTSSISPNYGRAAVTVGGKPAEPVSEALRKVGSSASEKK